MPDPLLVGIDVHRQNNTVHLMDGQGQEVAKAFAVANNRPGSQALASKLSQVASAGGHDCLQVAAEATGFYWWHLFVALSQDPLLAQWPLSLYPFNARPIANFKKAYIDLDKSDAIDPFVIADRLRWGRDLPQPFHADATLTAIRCLTRHRFHLSQNLAREKAYCLAYLYLKASEYTHLKAFSDVFGAASRAVIADFASIEDIAAIPLAELVEFIDNKGKGRFADPSQNARLLQQVAQDSYPLPEAMQAPVNLILRQSLQSISTIERQRQRLDAVIAEHMQAVPNSLQTIPGCGPVYSAGIIAEIGDLERFHHDEAKVAKFAGLKWRQTQSGDFKADETRLTRSGNPYLRYYFTEAANSVRRYDADYAAYYQRKYDEVHTHQHKRAIVLTARKLVRLVVRLLTTNQSYQPRRQ